VYKQESPAIDDKPVRFYTASDARSIREQRGFYV